MSSPYRVSFPSKPLKISFPDFPLKKLDLVSPVKVSARLLPVIFSIFKRVSSPSPEAVLFVRFAVIAELAREKSTVSFTPEPPSRVLSPVSPSSVSSPEPVVIFSISEILSVFVPSEAVFERRDTSKSSASEV